MMKILCAADTANGVGRSLKHLRNTQKWILVDTVLLMMLQQFPPIEETRWRPSFWARHSSICTCSSRTAHSFHWISLFLTQKLILFQQKALRMILNKLKDLCKGKLVQNEKLKHFVVGTDWNALSETDCCINMWSCSVCSHRK